VRGSGQGSLHTSDRALIELRREVDSLKLQLSERSTSEARQLYRGDNRGGFAQTGRGLLQLHHEIATEDFRPAIAHDHYLMWATEKVEITEAYWISDEDWTANGTDYSYIRLQEHKKSRNYRNSDEAQQLGYLSGQLKTVGPYATGDLRKGYPYRLQLEEKPITEKGSLIVADTRAATNPGVWPTGYLIVCWRWLS
jgi:hypothetical protein